ncbi:MAG: sugar kinase [Hylemonella sp.]
MFKSLDVVALGEAMLEFNQTSPGQPNFLQGFGGDTSNAVIAAARAGARTAYLTRLGDDTFGQALMRLWQQEGVDTAGVAVDGEHPTGIYFVTHGATGHEFSYLRKGSAASQMSPAWLRSPAVQTALRSTRYLHASGISLAISTSACDTVYAAMQAVREAGGKTSFDANLRLKLWPLERARACIAQAVALSDIFLPSLDDAVHLCKHHEPDAIIDWGHQLGAPVVVLKQGAAGALVSDGHRREQIAPHQVSLVDATGAGDCFSGYLLARLAQGLPLFEAARHANAAAALAVQGYGAVAPLPRPEAVAALL